MTSQSLTICVERLRTHHPPCGRHIGELFRLYILDTLTYVFSSNLK